MIRFFPPLICLLFLIFAGGVVFPSTLAAQEKERQIYNPGGTFTNSGAEAIRAAQRKSLKNNGFIRPEHLDLALVKYDYMEEGQFGMLFTVPDVISGCWSVTPLRYEASFIEPYYFDIKVHDYQRKVITTQDPADCPTGQKMSSALIIVDSHDLKARKIRQIRLSNGKIADYLDIHFMDNGGLKLYPQSMVVFKAKGLTGSKKDHLEMTFGGGGHVALHIPMAHQGEDVSAQIRAFANQHALVPLPDMPMGQDDGGSPVYYFDDVSGRALSMIGADGYAQLGEIYVPRPYDGPQGRTQIKTPLKVYATRPGTSL